MKQIPEANKWEDQYNELWQIYCNRQQFGNESVPFPVFEQRFWQHYERLQRNVKSDRLPSPTLPQKAPSYQYGIRQDLNTILRKYWPNTPKIHYRQMTPDMVNKNGCFTTFIAVVFGFIGLILIFNQLFIISIIWFVLGVGVVALQNNISTSQVPRVTLCLEPDFISYKSKLPEGQVVRFDLLYSHIEAYEPDNHGLAILGLNAPQEIIVPNFVDHYTRLHDFLKEVVACNQFRK